LKTYHLATLIGVTTFGIKSQLQNTFLSSVNIPFNPSYETYKGKVSLKHVMMTIFCDFREFFANFFGEKNLKIITSVRLQVDKIIKIEECLRYSLAPSPHFARL
jgi:hypothetical protein